MRWEQENFLNIIPRCNAEVERMYTTRLHGQLVVVKRYASVIPKERNTIPAIPTQYIQGMVELLTQGRIET
jgi:uncharacterized membrane protein